MIREATLDDVFDILVLSREFTKQAPSFMAWDKDKLEKVIIDTINNDLSCALVYEDDNEIKAALLGVTTDLFMSHVNMAVVVAWYVNKESRIGRAAYRMLDYFEKWGKEKGASIISVADVPEIKDLSRFYSLKGYGLKERSYLKEV